MTARFDAVLALLLTPFVATCLFALACVVALVVWHERPRRNRYAPTADVQAWRERMAREGRR